MFLFFYIKIGVNEEFLHPHQKLYNHYYKSQLLSCSWLFFLLSINMKEELRHVLKQRAMSFEKGYSIERSSMMHAVY